MGDEEMIGERLGEHRSSYEEVRDNMLRYPPDNPMRQVIMLQTNDTASRRIVAREAKDFVEAAISLGATCSSVVDPFMRAPEYAVVICAEGTAGQMADVASFMIRTRAARAR